MAIKRTGLQERFVSFFSPEQHYEQQQTQISDGQKGRQKTVGGDLLLFCVDFSVVVHWLGVGERERESKMCGERATDERNTNNADSIRPFQVEIFQCYTVGPYWANQILEYGGQPSDFH